MRPVLQLVLLCAITMMFSANGVDAADEIFSTRGDYSIVPGRLGYNALPTVPNGDPAIEDEIYVEIQGAVQFSDFEGTHISGVPYFRLIVPLRGVAALEFEGTPAEVWRISPETRDRIGAIETHGVSPGDLRFGARFLIFRETENLPAFGVRFVTKTTTGKDFENRRFTNAPAYIIDALFAKNILQGDGFIKKVRALAKIGFLAWQQGAQWQDDAVDYGATLQAVFRNNVRVDLEVRGYWGYQQDDKPLLLGVGLIYPTKHLDWVLTVNKGLSSDAPPWEVRTGFKVHFDVRYFNGQHKSRSDVQIPSED